MGSKDKITRRRVIAAGGATALFGGGVAYLATRSESGESGYVPESFHTGEGTTAFGVELGGRPIAGDRGAPVDIYYWTDYLCPFCKRFETETLPSVGREYVDTGEARLVVLPYPNIGAYSMPATVWSRCVWRQVAESDPTAFWRWHGAAFDAQPESGTDWADEETFGRITERTEGVPTEAVDSCRSDSAGSIRDAVETNLGVAQSAGIRGTPSFVLYNRDADAAGKLVGAHPFDTFSDSLDRVLAA
jgi:protein-disulfide isomerase